MSKYSSAGNRGVARILHWEPQHRDAESADGVGIIL